MASIMSERITEAELLDALAEATAGNGPDDARTLHELMGETGIPRDRMLSALRLCRAKGRLVVHSVWRESILGRRVRVPAYTITATKRKRS